MRSNASPTTTHHSNNIDRASTNSCSEWSAETIAAPQLQRTAAAAAACAGPCCAARLGASSHERNGRRGLPHTAAAAVAHASAWASNRLQRRGQGIEAAEAHQLQRGWRRPDECAARSKPPRIGQHLSPGEAHVLGRDGPARALPIAGINAAGRAITE